MNPSGGPETNTEVGLSFNPWKFLCNSFWKSSHLGFFKNFVQLGSTCHIKEVPLGHTVVGCAGCRVHPRHTAPPGRKPSFLQLLEYCLPWLAAKSL